MEITAADYVILHHACAALDGAGIPYVIGGGTVVVLYGRNRRTKDFDLFLSRRYQRQAMDALSLARFTTADTDKGWLYKAWRGETLIDLIVESRGRMQVTADTMRRARIVHQHGYFFRVMGPEDTLFRKILTLTEGRPDWHDALSILVRMEGRLDWNYLLELTRETGQSRRLLSFMLFARTELHNPPGTIRRSPDELYTGVHPGPVPDGVLYHLWHMLMEGDRRSRPLACLPEAV